MGPSGNVLQCWVPGYVSERVSGRYLDSCQIPRYLGIPDYLYSNSRYIIPAP